MLPDVCQGRWDFLDEPPVYTLHSARNLLKLPCAVEYGRDDPWEGHKQRQVNSRAWNEISSITYNELTVYSLCIPFPWLSDLTYMTYSNEVKFYLFVYMNK